MNERGIAAQGPIPPGIFGYEEGEKGTEPVVYDWKNGKADEKISWKRLKNFWQRQDIPTGSPLKQGNSLKLHYDAPRQPVPMTER